jgi:hypothetical protein
MIRPDRLASATRRATLLVVIVSALAIACLARPTGISALLVSPPTASVGVGDAVRLTATPPDGDFYSRAPSVAWSSSDTAVATVDATGLVTGVAPGSATIMATSGEQSGSAQIIVSPHPPGTVEDLTVAATTDSSVTLSFTEVSDGMGRPASYDVRYAAGSSSWSRSVAR